MTAAECWMMLSRNACSYLAHKACNLNLLLCGPHDGRHGHAERARKARDLVPCLGCGCSSRVVGNQKIFLVHKLNPL
jgi:hypothetical protein